MKGKRRPGSKVITIPKGHGATIRLLGLDEGKTKIDAVVIHRRQGPGGHVALWATGTVDGIVAAIGTIIEGRST